MHINAIGISAGVSGQFTATVTVIATSDQILSQSVTLTCNVITMGGTNERVDIVWSSNGTELERMKNVVSFTVGNSEVYTDSYTLSQLSTTDDGRVIQCEAVIDTTPPIMASGNITLDVISKYTKYCYVVLYHIYQYSMYTVVTTT